MPAKPARFDCRVVTYNCLTAATTLQRESLDTQFHRAGACVIGLQETRTEVHGRCDTAHYYVVGSPAKNGQEGCQVWLSKTLPLGHDARGPILWDANNLALLWACPRCVVISARAASLCFAFVSAHALTSKASEKECREWWNELQCAIRRAPANHIPILMLDANAHFAWSPAAPDRRTAQNCNATAFAQLLQENSLAATPNMTPGWAPGQQLARSNGTSDVSRLHCLSGFLAARHCF